MPAQQPLASAAGSAQAARVAQLQQQLACSEQQLQQANFMKDQLAAEVRYWHSKACSRQAELQLMQEQHDSMSAELQLWQQWGAQQQLDSGDAGLLPAALVEEQYEAAATVAEPIASSSAVAVSDSSLSRSSSSSGWQDDSGVDSLGSSAQRSSSSGALSSGVSARGFGGVNVSLSPSRGGAWAPWAGVSPRGFMFSGVAPAGLQVARPVCSMSWGSSSRSACAASKARSWWPGPVSMV